MKNDFDGGITVNPKFDAGNNKWVAELPADSLIRTLTPEYLAKSKAMYPEKKEKLKKLVENLKENDNPVIMIITLK
jgi:thiamine pyrophosphate-dependent acetolactate synthase large subunit-like protein